MISCGGTKQSIVTTDLPEFQQGDERFADVFKGLDGKWKGEFVIYEDSNLKNAEKIDLENLSHDRFNSPGMQEVNRIEVEQVYVSKSPYYQTVEIRDFYPKTGKVELSSGVNKVEEGALWCIVNKPNETIIHKGKTRGAHTIIWYQNQKSPQRVEYFQETVDSNYYEIIGYGYYEGDDVELSPKLWFHARYERE